MVRRISNRHTAAPPPPPPPPPVPQIEIDRQRIAPRAAAARRQQIAERYVVGSFQIKIPVETAATMLPVEENTLAIMKARLAAMAPTGSIRCCCAISA